MTKINVTYEDGATINPVAIYSALVKAGAPPIEVVPKNDSVAVCAYNNFARIEHPGRIANRVKRSILEVKSVEVVFGSSD